MALGAPLSPHWSPNEVPDMSSTRDPVHHLEAAGRWAPRPELLVLLALRQDSALPCWSVFLTWLPLSVKLLSARQDKQCAQGALLPPQCLRDFSCCSLLLLGAPVAYGASLLPVAERPCFSGQQSYPFSATIIFLNYNLNLSLCSLMGSWCYRSYQVLYALYWNYT